MRRILVELSDNGKELIGEECSEVIGRAGGELSFGCREGLFFFLR